MKIRYLKWILLLLGATKFGWAGAFIGFFVGQFIEELSSSKPDFNLFSGSEEEEEENIEIVVKERWMLVMIGGILQLNDFIPKEQSHYILRYLFKHYGTPKGKALYAELKRYLRLELDVVVNAKRLRASSTALERTRLINFLVGLCHEGKSLYPSEKTMLTVIAMNLGVSQIEFAEIMQKYIYQEIPKAKVSTHSALSAAFITLGLNEQANEMEVKKAYRRLVLQYHPDKTDLPDEIASKKFQEVHEAYTRVKEARSYK